MSLVLAAGLLVVGPTDAATPEVAIVVHPSRRDEPTLAEIRRIYLRQKRFWSDGSSIVPIGRDAASPVRRTFERATFGADRGWLPRYWDRQYFDGTFPPATLASDVAVLRYVAARPNAIGYLDARFLDESVRVVHRLTARATDATAPTPSSP